MRLPRPLCTLAMTIVCYQSDEGNALGFCSSISLPQQTTTPAPALVQSTSVPHTSHLNLLPSWFDILSLRKRSISIYFFCSIGWPQHTSWPLPPLVTINSEPHLLQKYFLPIWFAIVNYLQGLILVSLQHVCKNRLTVPSHGNLRLRSKGRRSFSVCLSH